MKKKNTIASFILITITLMCVTPVLTGCKASNAAKGGSIGAGAGAAVTDVAQHNYSSDFHVARLRCHRSRDP